METLSLILILLAAVLASAVVDQIVPRVSLPLVQIGAGLVVALFASQSIDVSLDPELFLVLFIAPLLYDEAKATDKAALWQLRKPVLSLAIGLVVATALGIGFTLHALEPSIPLAAAFALGAALGPTDAVAVSSLSKVVAIPDRQRQLLQGELLLNDASGIVSFQFAIGAVVTGSFSLLHAGIDFAIEFFGGLLVGALLGILAKTLLDRAQRVGVDNTTFHVLFEVFAPFLVYLIADAMGVSGIISVVVVGLMNITSTRDAGPSVSRMNIVSDSVWKVLAFALNGIVFVLLGTQLPQAMQSTWDDVTINNFLLIAYVLIITGILLLVRFLWVAAMELHRRQALQDGRSTRCVLRDTLITTLSGPKGTITLSIMFSIPYMVAGDPITAFPQRDLLIFLACGVIVCTLLISTFVVPLIAPKPKQADADTVERETKALVDMLSQVMAEIAAMHTPENRRAVERATNAYKTRIAKLVNAHNLEDEDSELRLQAIQWQREKVESMLRQDEVDPQVARVYLARLEKFEATVERKNDGNAVQRPLAHLRLIARDVKNAVVENTPNLLDSSQEEALRELRLAAHEHVLELLTMRLSNPEYPSGETSALIMNYQRVCNALRQQSPSITVIAKAENESEEYLLKGYALEIEKIQELYDDGLISRETARRARNNVAIMRMDAEGL